MVLCALLCAGQAASAHAAETDFNVPAQRADLALTEFARQADLAVLFPFEEVSRFSTNRLVGRYSVEEGARMLLEDTGLTARVDEGWQLVVRVAPLERGGAPVDEGRTRAFASSSLSKLGRSSRTRGGGADVAPMDEITVTGSRIRAMSGMNTPVPVTMVTAQDLDFSAPGALIDALDRMPQFLGSSRPGVGQGIGSTAGQSILNMRGIGFTRTLVLLDGRRIVPTTRQGTTDISIFPDSMVERVEVVTGGASAAYGTDAVSGVTNFILDTDFEGFKGQLQAGATSRGDTDNWEASFGFGTALGERVHVIASLDHAKSDALLSWDDRDWFQDWGVVTNPAWPASGPQLLTRPSVTTTLYTLGGLINQPGSALHRQMFLPDGSITPFVQGSPAAVGSGTNSHQGPGTNIQRDRGLFGVFPSTDRYNVFAHLTYAASDSLELSAQVLTGRTDVVGNGFPSVLFGPWQARIFRDNAFLSDQVRQIMIDEGLQSFGFSRMGSTADTTVSDILQRNTFDSYTFGFEKTLNSWRIDGYLQYGRNDGLLDIRNWIRTSHLFPAIDAVRHPTTGEIVCNRTLYDPSFRCVPINLLGSGRATPEAIAFVTEGIKAAHTNNRQRVFEVSADGEVFAGWAGPISLALGATYRQDSLVQIVDDPTNPTNDPNFVAVPLNDPNVGYRGIPAGFLGVNSGIQFSVIPNFRGDVNVKEVFSEVLVPLMRDRALARQLNMSAAVRWADYTGSGSIWSSKFGLDWQAIDALRVRGTWSRDVRAANMSERFDAAGGGVTVQDPVFGNTSHTFTQISGGNPEVDPEEADTVTVGVVVQPPRFEGFSLSADWYSIVVNGSIGQLGSQRIVTDCFLGATALCAQITRDPVTNIILGVRNVFLNINEMAVSGVDVEAVWTKELGGNGRSLSLRTLGSWLEENSITNLGAPKQDRAGETGALTLPDFQLVTSATYRHGPFTAFLQGRYVSDGLRRYNGNRPDLGGLTIDNNRVASNFITDLRVSYNFSPRDGNGNWEVFGNITNLFDKDPPLAANHTDFFGSQHTNVALYDVLGRRFVAGARFTF